MNTNPISKRLLWLVLLGACLVGGGFFAKNLLGRRSAFDQKLDYQMDVMSDLHPVAADPWQGGTDDFTKTQPAPPVASLNQVDSVDFLRSTRGETTVAASSSLQAAVTQEFEAKQKLQEAQVQLLEQRVRELRRILEYRSANRRKIIADRVRELGGIETDSLGNVQPTPGPNFQQLTSPIIGNAVVQVPPRTGSLHANPTPYSSSVPQSNPPVTLPELSARPKVPANALLDALGVKARPPEPADGKSYANQDAVEEHTTAANYSRTNLLANDQVALLGAISPPTQVNAPVREIDFGPQNKFMRAVALGMFRGEKGVFLSADEGTFVMQATPSQHERFAAVAHEIFTSPYVSPDRLGTHLRDLEFQTKQMQSLLDSKDGRSPFAKEGRRKLEESLRRNEDLIAAFEAIIQNHKRSGDVAEELALPQDLPAEETAPIFEERPVEARPVFEEPYEVLETAAQPTVDYSQEPEETSAAEPAVESGDLPKEFSRGAETQPEEETTEPAESDAFGLSTESR